MNVRKSLVRSFVLSLALLCASAGFANPLAPGSYLWYVPEHEKYGRTEFYSLQDLKSALVRVPRTQRFKILAARYNWVLLEFDIAGRAFIPIRMLRYALYDPDASDPYYEFKRASVFAEEPAKIEARLKGPQQVTPAAVDSKTPAWKRYKDSWGLKPGRSTTATGGEDAPAEGPQSNPRPVAGSPTAKARSKYPLLTPIGSEPQSETTQSEASERAPEATAPR